MLKDVERANVWSDRDIAELFAGVFRTVARHANAFFFAKLIRLAVVDRDVCLVGA